MGPVARPSAGKKTREILGEKRVRGGGLEPPLLSKPEPKSGASTSFAILAGCGRVAAAERISSLVGYDRASSQIERPAQRDVREQLEVVGLVNDGTGGALQR